MHLTMQAFFDSSVSFIRDLLIAYTGRVLLRSVTVKDREPAAFFSCDRILVDICWLVTVDNYFASLCCWTPWVVTLLALQYVMYSEALVIDLTIQFSSWNLRSQTYCVGFVLDMYEWIIEEEDKSNFRRDKLFINMSKLLMTFYPVEMNVK